MSIASPCRCGAEDCRWCHPNTYNLPYTDSNGEYRCMKCDAVIDGDECECPDPYDYEEVDDEQ